jgi:hypothetical protein
MARNWVGVWAMVGGALLWPSAGCDVPPEPSDNTPSEEVEAEPSALWKTHDDFECPNVNGTKPVNGTPVNGTKPGHCKPVNATKPGHCKPVNGTKPKHCKKPVNATKPRHCDKPVNGTKPVNATKPPWDHGYDETYDDGPEDETYDDGP